MDLLKSQLERIQRQLAGLTATQKMLTAALVAIMAMTVIWWGKYAGESEMVSLTSQSFSAGELGKIDEKLTAKGYRHAVTTDKVMVPADQRTQILAYLIYSKAMPRGTSEAMDEILKQRNVFDSAETSDRLWNRGKEALLSEMIRSFPDVEDASVILSPVSAYRIGGNIDPRATVYITTGPDVHKLHTIANAAADLACGAQPGLIRKNVMVVINEQPQHLADSDSDIIDASEQLTNLRMYEDLAEEHIRKAFSSDRLLVSVVVKLNNTSVVKEQTEYDAKNVVQKELQSTSDNDETSSTAPPASGEAAAVPNTGVAVGGPAGSSAQSQTREKTETKFDVRVPQTVTHSRTPGGDATPQSATVSFPYSYFVQALRSSDPSIKEPTPVQLDAFIKAQLPQLQKRAALAAGIASLDQVAVSAYPDQASAGAMPVATAATGVGMVSVMVGGHAKEIALGALALMSLFMASMMVRKGQPSPVPAPAIAQPAPPMNPPVLMGGEPIAGEAGPGDPLLDGMELNEEAIKAQQMVDQVSTMVRENPDSAATLVKRWLNRI